MNDFVAGAWLMSLIWCSAKRYRCEWGTWGLVAPRLRPRRENDVGNGFRRRAPCSNLAVPGYACRCVRGERADRLSFASPSAYRLHRKARTHPADVPWLLGGWNRRKRFNQCVFPFFVGAAPGIFRQSRLLFSASSGSSGVSLKGIRAHMGSQWWCLTRQTLRRSFRTRNAYRIRRPISVHVWIPDESLFFQTLAALYFHPDRKPVADTPFQVRFQGRHIFLRPITCKLLAAVPLFPSQPGRKIWPGKAGRSL